jgi:hypothetical protein
MPDWDSEIRRRLAGLQLTPMRDAATIEEVAQQAIRQNHRLQRSSLWYGRSFCSKINFHLILSCERAVSKSSDSGKLEFSIRG